MFGLGRKVHTPDLNTVAAQLRQMGFEVVPGEGNRIRARHQKFFNVVVQLSSNCREVLFVSFFGAKRTVAREVLIDGANKCNLSVTLSTFAIDGDGDVLVSRCLLCDGGYTLEQLRYLIEEGDREIASAASKHLREYME